MKIVKPIDVTDEVLIDSSIPMPDVARGEIEWQTKEQRQFQISGPSISAPLIDSVYIESHGLYVLSGNIPSGYKISKVGDDGVVQVEVVVPVIGTGQAENISLSFDSVNQVLLVGRVIWRSSGALKPGWDFDYRGVSLDLLSQSNFDIPLGFRYNNYGQDSIFKFKTDGVNVVFLAINKENSINEVSYELVLFTRDGMNEISKTNLRFSDFFTIGDEVYCLSNAPVLSGIETLTRVTVFDLLFSEKRTIDFPGIDGEWVRPKVNAQGSTVNYSTESQAGQVLTQVYDKNMINIGSYKRNDEVIKSSTKRKYRCAVDATFDDPELGVNLSPPTWVDIGSVNRWMPFDKQPSQQAVSDNPMYYKLKPGEFVRSLSIFNISSVSSVTVKVTDPVDGVIYDKDFDLVDNLNVVDMWTYLTLPISFKKELIITDLVCFRDSEIEITLSGERPAVGAIVTGNESPVGRCVKGTGVRSNQFSIRKENGFGGFDIIQRGVGKIARFRVAYDISQIDYITNLLESIDSQYCVFIGELPNNQVISIYGILDPYQSDFETPTINTLEFDVLGVL